MAEGQTVQEPADVVTVDVEGGVATVRINRPKALNALNRAVLDALDRAVARVEDDDAVRGVILTGAGEKAFVAGADISEMVKYGPVEGADMAHRGQGILNRIERSSKVWVAAVNGFALGGGCELAMACDMIVASESARFGQPEVTIGVTPGFAGTQRLPRLVGKARAKELVLTGRQIDAEEALRIGLVVKAVPEDDLIAECRTLLGAIAKNAPVAVRLSKELINRGTEVDLDAAQQMEADAFGVCFSTDDQKEGMKAFLDKREPDYQGK